jgi:hypothetical protein
MPILFRGIPASEYGPLLVTALEAAISTWDAATIMDAQIDIDRLNSQQAADAFSDAYELSQTQAVKLQFHYRQLDSNKPGGRLPRVIHQYASRYIDAIARRTDAANNLKWSQIKGMRRDVGRYQKAVGVYNNAVKNQARLLADAIDQALLHDPATAGQLRLSRDLAAQIRGSADAKKQPKTQSSEAQALLPEMLEETVFLFQIVRDLWLSGHMDISTTGPVAVAEDDVLTVVTDMAREWLPFAALAWRGYEMYGRGILLLNNHKHGGNYYPLTPEQVPPWLPSQVVQYCANYDPRTEIVLAIYGFPEFSAPETCASLWIRPGDTWTTPPEAWRQVDYVEQGRIDTVLRSTPR